jgi:uncharacterized protein YecE (DUF72 family)
MLDRFLGETSALESKRGALLVQLPPSLEFDARIATRFFELLRRRSSDFVLCEPRHASWFSPDAEALPQQFEAGRVAANPTAIAGADRPGGWPASSITGCTARRASTGRRTNTPFRKRSSTRSGAYRNRRLHSASSTTRPGGGALENAWQLSALLNGEPR